MAAPTIIRGSDHMFSTTYEGNGGGQKVGNFVPFTDNGTIAKSAIFDNGGPAYLSKTYGSAGTSLKKFTFSCWFKLGRDSIAGTAGYFPVLFNVGGESGKYFSLFYQSQNQNFQYYSYNSTYDLRGITVRTFEDTSKWYHIVIAIDTTESTAADRVKLYVDGDRITSFTNQVNPAQDYDLSVGAAEPYYVGYQNSGDTWDGYIAEANYVDGTALTPSTFGLTDTSTGRWIPKTLTGITYGSNGFRMQFANSAGQTIGDDTSGNGNDFSVNNMVAADIVTDSPTQNHATLSPHSLYKSSNFTLTEGNLKATSTSVSGTHSGQGAMRIPSGGKYYWECEIDAGKDGMGIGIIPDNTPTTSANPSTAGTTLYLSSGAIRTTGSDSLSYGSGVDNGDIMGFALDLSDPQNGKLYVSVNGTYENSGNPVTGANPAPSKVLKGDFRVIYQDGSNGYTPVYIYNFGQRAFNTSPPTGYSALQQDNFPETGKGIPDLVWIKNRDATDSHQLYDSTRGPQIDLNPDGNGAESTTTDGLQKFLKGGCQIEDNVAINTSGESYVSWNWVAGEGTTSANSDGSGATLASTIQVNQTAGFSIVSYTGNATSGAKVAHGLSQKPEWFILKPRSMTGNHYVYHEKIGADYFLYLNLPNARYTGVTTPWNDTEPTDKIITLTGTGYGSNNNSENYIIYAWHSVEGFSKFGSYLGNGNANGPFIYTGFKPSWLMIKNMNRSVDWIIIDNKRDPTNDGSSSLLKPNETDAESQANNQGIDLLSNGFKVKQSSSNAFNASTETHVYMAFAEFPFVGNGTNPVTAR